MKKISLAILKILILLFSFAAIALAFLMRDSIDPILMYATMGTAFIMIVIVIALLVNEKPTDPNYKQKSAPAAPVAAAVKTAKAITTPTNSKTKIKRTKKTRYKIRVLENGDITFSRFVEEGDKVVKVRGKKAPITHADLAPVVDAPQEEVEPMEVLQPVNAPTDDKIPNPYTMTLRVEGKHLENLLAVIEAMKADRLVHRNPDYSNFDLLPAGIKYYESNFESIPVVTLIKQAQNIYKLMAGTSTMKLHEISVFSGDDFDTLDQIHRHIQKVDGFIKGGNFNLIEFQSSKAIKEFESNSIELKIYHNA